MRKLVCILAVVLLTVLFLSGCSSKKTNGSAEEQAAVSGQSGSRKVNVLAAGLLPDGNYMGAAYDTKVEVSTDKDQRLRVEFVEDDVGRSGDMWRASGWQAATVALLATGFSASNKVMSFDVTGDLGDGPSASALLAVTLISILRGDKMRSDITMTGMINPDGTIGPVGAIPGKLQAAKEKKIDQVFIPVGQRTEYNPITDEQIDLYDYGKELGVEVEEVEDIYQAYKLFTGKELPRWGKATNDLDLKSDTADLFESRAKDWFAKYEKARGEFAALDPAIQELFLDTIAEADWWAATSDANIAQGMPAAAFDAMVQATIFASTGAQGGQIVNLFMTQGRDAVIAQLNAAISSTSSVQSAFEELESVNPKTIVATSGVIDGYSWLSKAVAFSDMAGSYANSLTTDMTDEDFLMGSIYSVLNYQAAEILTEFALDMVKLQEDLDSPKIPESTNIELISDFFRRAAEANFNAFVAVAVGSLAEEYGYSEEAALQAFEQADPDVATTAHAAYIIEAFDDFSSDEEDAQLAKLGAALNLYTDSAKLISTYISLGAYFNDEYEIEGYASEKALTSELDFAEEQVEYAIGGLQQHKINAAVPVALYEVAEVERETGTPADKTAALGDLWRSYVSSRLMSYLGGFAETSSEGSSSAKK